MTYSLAYWIVIFIWLLFAFWQDRASGWKALAPNLVLLILFILIGLQIFGKPLHQ